MFTGNEDVEATALREQGWSISAIARHLNRDRATIRNHLNGTRIAGKRKRSEPDPFEEFVPYLGERLREDPHVWATALYDEVCALGFELSYPSFTRGLRGRELRPHCEACAGVKGRATIEIEHPPGEEIQWDWDELPEAPWDDDTHLLLGSLPCSGKFRGVFAESEDQPHLIEAMDGVLRRIGGNARRWRVDRMATVVNPKTRGGPAELRPRGQALRRLGGGLSAPTGESKGFGGEVHPLRHPALLAHHDGADHGPGPRAAGPVLRTHRRSPTPAACQAREHRGQRRRLCVYGCPASPAPDGGRPGRAREAAAPSRGVLPGHHRGHQFRSGPRPSFPSRATPTRSRPG